MTEAETAPTETLRALLHDAVAELDSFGGPAFNEDAARKLLEYGREIVTNGADAASYNQVLQEVARLCITGQRPQLLDRHGIAHPTYNIYASYGENSLGPWGQLPLHVVPVVPATTLLGADVGIPFGVSASALTSNPNWVDFYATRGFNVLTFKTVRSRECPPYPPPNWLFTHEVGEPLPLGMSATDLNVTAGVDDFPKDPRSFSTVNSFGVPSPPTHVWQRQVVESLASLRPGQLLIVSVMGEPDDDITVMAESFAATAVSAEETGASVVELNLSCPNTATPDGRIKEDLIYHSTAAIERVVLTTRQALRDTTKLVIKLGYLPYARLAEAIAPISTMVDGVAGINTIQVPATDYYTGQPAFVSEGTSDGPRRHVAGLSGVGIRSYALDFTASLNRIRSELSCDFDILAMGGVMNAADVTAFLDAGAQAVQSATGAFGNHNLGREVAAALHRRFPPSAGMLTAMDNYQVDAVLWRLLKQYRTLDLLDLQGFTDFSTTEILDSIRRLSTDGTAAVQRHGPALRVALRRPGRKRLRSSA